MNRSLLGRVRARWLRLRGEREGRAVSRDDMERLLGVSIRNIALYEQALRHRSLARGNPSKRLASNERLEFLGDAVLGFVVAEHLYQSFPAEMEGFLTPLRAKIVNRDALARVASELELGKLMLMSRNLVQRGGRRNPAILADTLEALIGALYLDRGVAAARRFIQRCMLASVDLSALAAKEENFKSMLLEFVQSQGGPQPQYQVIASEGPGHKQSFTVEVLINGAPRGRGWAMSKKHAEQLAAHDALQQLQT